MWSTKTTSLLKEPFHDRIHQRYLQDLRLRYSPKTLQTYVECVSLFARYFKRSPEELGRASASTSVTSSKKEVFLGGSTKPSVLCVSCIATPSVDWAISHYPFRASEETPSRIEPR
jgi:hypothetical protein